MRPAVRSALTQLMPGVDRFGLVLTLLVVSYLVMALGGSSAPRILEGSFAVIALWLALQASAADVRVRLLAAAMLLAAFLAVVVITQSVVGSTARGLGELWFVVVFMLTLIAVLRRVLIHQEVTLETICGALSAYLLLGMMFAAVFGAMSDLGDQRLFVQVADPTIPQRQYFSFTTLTTLGYGDITAATDIGRAVATLEAICGQIFLVTLIARLVANFAGRRPTH
jgi:voltage-gated potassium channel Kch